MMDYITSIIAPIILIGSPIETTFGLIVYERLRTKQKGISS